MCAVGDWATTWRFTDHKFRALYRYILLWLLWNYVILIVGRNSSHSTLMQIMDGLSKANHMPDVRPAVLITTYIAIRVINGGLNNSVETARYFYNEFLNFLLWSPILLFQFGNEVLSGALNITRICYTAYTTKRIAHTELWCLKKNSHVLNEAHQGFSNEYKNDK